MDIGDSFQNTTDKIFDFLPNLVGFLLILLVGFIIAKVVAGIVGKLLDKVHIDRRLHVPGAFLLPPARESGHIDPFRDGNAEILMRTDRPRRAASLREQRALHADGIRWQQRRERRQ